MLLILLTAFFALLTSCLTDAAVVTRTDTLVTPGSYHPENTPIVAWPETAVNWKRNYGMTNAERLKRGLQPSAPRGVYERKDSQNQKRWAGYAEDATGRTPGPSSVSRAFKFLSCKPNGLTDAPGFNSYSITFTSVQDFADQCATKLAAGLPTYLQNFYLGTPSSTTGPGTGACYTSVNTANFADGPCSVTQFVVYGPA